VTLDIILDADPEWDSSSGWADLARSAANAAIAESAFPQLAEGPRPVEISVRLAGDAEVQQLNAQWRGKDKPTNVLSFPMAEAADLDGAARGGAGLMLGDIILAHGVCGREAEAKAVPIERHAAHLMVHGTLHLLGYDHGDEREAADMEAREVRALARIGIADPYAAEALG
jgi:probable rRNA maturation factor